jgi:hypothetical protein
MALINPNAINACILLTSITLDYQLVHSTAMLRLLHHILEGVAQPVVSGNRHSTIGNCANVDKRFRVIIFSRQDVIFLMLPMNRIELQANEIVARILARIQFCPVIQQALLCCKSQVNQRSCCMSPWRKIQHITGFQDQIHSK